MWDCSTLISAGLRSLAVRDPRLWLAPTRLITLSTTSYAVLGLSAQKVHQSSSGWSPVWVSDSLGVMSIGFLLPDQDDAVIWRGPRKNGLIRQFLTDVEWGSLDYLIIDTPPGTSDEHISIVQVSGRRARVYPTREALRRACPFRSTSKRLRVCKVPSS